MPGPHSVTDHCAKLDSMKGAAGRLVSGFGSGAAFSWVSGMTPTPQGVFTSAVLMALTQGAFYKVLIPSLRKRLQLVC